jgi:hypothetical protein
MTWDVEETDSICRTIYVQLPAKNVVKLQAYFDLSENLGSLRTISVADGCIAILTTADLLPDCYSLLDSLADSLGIRQVEN